MAAVSVKIYDMFWSEMIFFQDAFTKCVHIRKFLDM